MKKILSIISALALLLGTTALSSCDPDQWTGYTLAGTWQGTMESCSSYNGRYYYSTSTEIEFSTDPYTYSAGYGYWIDYYNDSSLPYDRWVSRISWTVNNGIIRINFAANNGTIEIHDYRLNNNRFEGWFYDDENTVCKFSMAHVDSPHWSSYDDGWGFYNDYDYYDYSNYYYNWAKPAIGAGNADSSKPSEPIHLFHKK